jgi:dienelactone hydrolase
MQRKNTVAREQAARTRFAPACFCAMLGLAPMGILPAQGADAGVAVETVRFPSADGRTQLTGYVFKPAGTGPFPAVVMLHGRAGPYSSNARGKYSAETLSLRHKEWGAFWAERGYLGLHVDSFGPRGFFKGFPIHSYSSRPAQVNEQTVRPLDARGALEYLRGRGDVAADRIGVQGWSNGAMTVLALLGAAPVAGEVRFRAALALYPGCREQEKQDYHPYAPLLMLVAGDDEEVSADACVRLAEKLVARGEETSHVLYAGAQHAFDDPGSRKQALPANRTATDDAKRRAGSFFASRLAAGADAR